jgi:hypothetical protein
MLRSVRRWIEREWRLWQNRQGMHEGAHSILFMMKCFFLHFGIFVLMGKYVKIEDKGKT